MPFDINFIWLQKEILLSGLLITIGLSVLIVFFGTIVGLMVAFGKRSKSYFVSKFCSLYTDFFRVMPALIMLIWIFYALPIFTGIRFGPFETGVIVLSLHLSGYIGELIRSGIEAIPKGEVEAARVLGLTEFQIMQRIVLPQVVRQLLSPLMGLYIEEVKNTTLVSVIALNELLHTGQIVISQTYRPLEIYSAIAIMFIVILLPLTFVAKKFEHAEFVKRLEVNDHE